MKLRKAARQKAKLRLGISGPTGSGKTISALLIAFGITGDWEKIAVIDTENNSADLYANHTITSDGKKFTIGEFNVIPLDPPYTPERFVEAIETCEKEGIEVIISDSISHEWNGSGGILEIVDNLKASSGSKNAFTNGWNEASPRHAKFVDKMLASPCHVIGCMRSKTDYVLEAQERNGKTIQVPKKVGMAPIQREGLDYEFTIHLDLNTNNYATAMKDRSGLFTGGGFIVTVKHGEMLRDWCEAGIDVEAEVHERIKQLANCTTQEEFIDFCEPLSELVKSDKRFRAAASARQKELKGNESKNTPA